MEKYNFEVTKEMKTNELSLVEGYGIVKSEDLGPDGLFICHYPQLEGTCCKTSGWVLALPPHLLA